MNTKSFGLAVLLTTAVVAGAFAKTASFYNHYGTTTYTTNPPVIDATNFVNYGYFEVFTSTELPYDFSNVRNYTNRNFMLAPISGFRFDYAPSSVGNRGMAASFHNGSLSLPATNTSIFGYYNLAVAATNVVSRGILGVSEYGLLSVQGRDVDLSRSILKVGSFSQRSSFLPEAVFDQYWGAGLVRNSDPAFDFTELFQFTPSHWVTNFFGYSPIPYFPNQTAFALFDTGEPAGLISSVWSDFAGTNGTIQIVFVRTSNTNDITTEISRQGGGPFRPGVVAVTWSAVGTNAVGQIFTNRISLVDDLGSNPTNTTHLTNFPFATPPPFNLPIQPQSYQPENFSIIRDIYPIFFFPDDPGVPFVDPDDLEAFWGPGPVTNIYSAYGVKIATTTYDPVEITRTRQTSGRIEIKGDRNLDLNLTRIDGLNYLKLDGTNHFRGASNSSVSVTYADIALGSTNGQLNFTGVLNPVTPRINGTIDAYSAVWTNTVVIGPDTNTVRFHVLVVDANLEAFTRPTVFDLSLRSTNATIGDQLVVNNNLKLDVENLTFSTNGSLEIFNAAVNWADGGTRIRNLTNNGLIYSINDLQFIGRNTNGSDRPYRNFVNNGTVYAAGIVVSATNIINNGYLYAGLGPVEMHSPSNVTLTDLGTIETPYSELTINCRNLTVTNQLLLLGRGLNLAVTNSLRAGANYWEVYDGFRLLSRPATGDFAETVIYDNAFPYADVQHQWAGLDRGFTPAGFTNNAALGQLILDGGLYSMFTFAGVGPSSNALYVDALLLQNDAALTDADGNIPAINCLPGMKIYYSQAYSNGVDVTADLAGRNGGALVQLPHVGPLSLTKAPFKASDIDLRVQISQNPPATIVSWNTRNRAINSLYSVDRPGDTNWVEVTNFVSTTSGRTAVTLPLQGNGRFFRVQVKAR